MARIVETKHPVGFCPFTIEIESKEELALLWALLDGSIEDVPDAISALKRTKVTAKEIAATDVEYSLWDLLDDKMAEYGLTKGEV